MALLAVERLQTHFGTLDGVARAVEGLSFHIDKGETVAIVGESGCGKSVTSMSILRLIPEPPGKIAGRIVFEGRNLLELSDAEMRKIPRQGDQHDLPGADDQPEPPVLNVGPPDRRDLASARGHVGACGGTAQRGDPHPGRHPGAGAAGYASIRTKCRAGCGSG